MCKADVIRHVNLKYNETLIQLHHVSRVSAERTVDLVIHRSKQSRRTGYRGDIVGTLEVYFRYGEVAIGVALRNGSPALAHCSEVATPGLDLVFASGSIDEPVKAVSVARGLHRWVVENFVEDLVPDFNWKGWRRRAHGQKLFGIGTEGGVGGLLRDARDGIKAKALGAGQLSRILVFSSYAAKPPYLMAHFICGFLIQSRRRMESQVKGQTAEEQHDHGLPPLK